MVAVSSKLVGWRRSHFGSGDIVTHLFRDDGTFYYSICGSVADYPRHTTLDYDSRRCLRCERIRDKRYSHLTDREPSE